MTWSLLLSRKRNDMKTKTGKKLILYLTVVLLILYLLPVCAAAEGETGNVTVATFDELKEHCAKISAGQSTATLLCTEENLVISEEFEIPSGMVILPYRVNSLTAESSFSRILTLPGQMRMTKRQRGFPEKYSILARWS